MLKRNLLVIGTIGLFILLFFEIYSLTTLIAADQKTISSSQSFKQNKVAETSQRTDSSSKATEKSEQSVPSSETQALEPKQNTTQSQNPTDKSVAISFDDGPGATTTPQLLQILKEKKVHATFFVLGEKAAQHPEIVKQAAKEGHEIGNHTFNHQDLTRLSTQAIMDEVTKTDNEIKKATGKKATFIRPPYGSITKVGAEIIQRPIIQWSVDSEDWRTRNTESIIQKIQTTVYDGSIILFHDIYLETINAIPKVIDYLKEQGYRITTVGDLLGHPTAVENYYGRNDRQAYQ